MGMALPAMFLTVFAPIELRFSVEAVLLLAVPKVTQ